jgi:hypothetical protein
MSMAPVSSSEIGGSLARHASPMRSQRGGRGKRTLSVDTGLGALVTQFYEEKLMEAKEAADEDLKNFLKDVVQGILDQTLANAAQEVLQTLEKIKMYAQQILVAEAFELAGGKFKNIIGDIMKLKDAEHLKNDQNTQKFLNKLLLIISTFSRLLGYLVSSYIKFENAAI